MNIAVYVVLPMEVIRAKDTVAVVSYMLLAFLTYSDSYHLQYHLTIS
jgi:hypothetical protein